MFYIVEIQIPTQAPAYVVATADTVDDARALVDAQLGRDESTADVVIVGVHAVH